MYRCIKDVAFLHDKDTRLSRSTPPTYQKVLLSQLTKLREIAIAIIDVCCKSYGGISIFYCGLKFLHECWGPKKE